MLEIEPNTQHCTGETFDRIYQHLPEDMQALFVIITRFSIHSIKKEIHIYNIGIFKRQQRDEKSQ